MSIENSLHQPPPQVNIPTQNNLHELEAVMAALPHLPPQVARFVRLLILHRGRVVRHSVIHNHLWPEAKQFERYRLTQEAVRARAYLGDTAPYKLIINVPGFGYKWGGPLTAEEVTQ